MPPVLRVPFNLALLGALISGFVVLGNYLIGMLPATETTETTPKQPDAYDISARNARHLCEAWDATRGLSQPCEVSGWESSVKVSIDTNGPEARKMCDGVVKTLNAIHATFVPGWKLKIYSPLTGDKTLAVCDLPSSASPTLGNPASIKPHSANPPKRKNEDPLPLR